MKLELKWFLSVFLGLRTKISDGVQRRINVRVSVHIIKLIISLNPVGMTSINEWQVAGKVGTCASACTVTFSRNDLRCVLYDAKMTFPRNLSSPVANAAYLAIDFTNGVV